MNSLQILVKEAFRVLKPGGLLILETPNPENLLVSTTEFYLDPTHNKPIPSKLLYFLAEYNGFARIKLLQMQESQSISSLAKDIDVTDIFFAVSPEYAVVAQKRAPDEQMSLFDQAFNRESGLTIDDLALLYAKNDQQLAAYEHDRWQWLESEWNASKVRIEDLNLELQSFYSSRCWRITAPLRAGFGLQLRVKGTFVGISHVLRRKIGSIAGPLLDRMVRFAIAHPSLKLGP